MLFAFFYYIVFTIQKSWMSIFHQCEVELMTGESVQAITTHNTDQPRARASLTDSVNENNSNATLKTYYTVLQPLLIGTSVALALFIIVFDCFKFLQSLD